MPTCRAPPMTLALWSPGSVRAALALWRSTARMRRPRSICRPSAAPELRTCASRWMTFRRSGCCPRRPAPHRGHGAPPVGTNSPLRPRRWTDTSRPCVRHSNRPNSVMPTKGRPPRRRGPSAAVRSPGIATAGWQASPDAAKPEPVRRPSLRSRARAWAISKRPQPPLELLR